MTKGTKRVILIYIFVVVVLGVITELLPQVTGALTKTEILQYENLQITDKVNCYFVRNETVYMANGSGAINYYIGDGVKVRKNTKILDVVPQAATAETSEYADIVTRLGSTDVTLTQMNSDQNGIVGYYIDGYEGYFTPEAMKNLSYDKVQELKIEPVNLTRKTTLAGEPLFKICEGSYWYLICWVDPANISKYEVGNTVKIDLPMGQIKADIESMIDQNEKWLVIMKTARYYEDFAKVRSAKSTIITQEYSGILVRNSSITTEDGVTGVYIRAKNGDYNFKPINIITSDGENSLVSVSTFYDKKSEITVKTVEVYDEILKNPEQDSDSGNKQTEKKKSENK